jgi:hypothetical protein
MSTSFICANSSPAKGRVERAHKTLQDRLVKELRLPGASTPTEGNAPAPDIHRQLQCALCQAAGE